MVTIPTSVSTPSTTFFSLRNPSTLKRFESFFLPKGSTGSSLPLLLASSPSSSWPLLLASSPLVNSVHASSLLALLSCLKKKFGGLPEV